MCKTMTTIEYPQPNTTVARLHISLDTASEKEVKTYIKEELTHNDPLPSGATVINGTGYWMPTDDDGNIIEDKKEVESNLIIEMWIDDEIELMAVKDLKNFMEDKYNQDCVCLSLSDRYYEH